MNSYEAGQDYALHGANLKNCHFSYFATAKMTIDWERGRDETLVLLKGVPKYLNCTISTICGKACVVRKEQAEFISTMGLPEKMFCSQKCLDKSKVK